MAEQEGTRRPLRLFVHYVLLRLVLLWYFCHPGTCATFADSREYLMKRYPNRHLVPQDMQNRQPVHKRTSCPRKSSSTSSPEFQVDSLEESSDLLQQATKLYQRLYNTAASVSTGSLWKSNLAFVAPSVRPTPEALSKQLSRKAAVSIRRPTRPAAISTIYTRRCRGGDTSMLLGWGSQTTQKHDSEPALRASSLLFDSVPASPVMPGSDDFRFVPNGGAIQQGRNKDTILTNIVHGAVDVYDTALSYVGCVLVTSPLGKKYLNPPQSRDSLTVPASATKSSVLRDTFDLVGFMDVDPLEASRRRR